MRNRPDTAFTRLLQKQSSRFTVAGLPADAEPADVTLLRTRLLSAAESFAAGYGAGKPLQLTIANGPAPQEPEHRPVSSPTSEDDNGPTSLEDRASYFQPIKPVYSFDFLVLPAGVRERLLLVVETMRLRTQLFDRWNLRLIEPHPSSAINLHGAPGTGKTLAAHAIADHLGKNLLIAKYSQLESKYHGEGPKNLDALFHAARKHDAILFLDEADSVMSQRFERTSQGSEHAVNAMRSELIMSLDAFEGLVIFATNFVVSYDNAFDSRVRHVEFPKPDTAARAEIWRRHLPPELPLAADVSVDELAVLDDITGRDIRRAVIDAATRTALDSREKVTQTDLLNAITEIVHSRISRSPRPHAPNTDFSEKIAQAARGALPPGEPATNQDDPVLRPGES